MTKTTNTCWMGGWKLKIERKVGGGSKKKGNGAEREYTWLMEQMRPASGGENVCVILVSIHHHHHCYNNNNKQRRKKKREGGKRERWVGSGRVEGWKVWSRRSAQTLLFLRRRLLRLCLSAYRFLSLSLSLSLLIWFRVSSCCWPFWSDLIHAFVVCSDLT